MEPQMRYVLILREVANSKLLTKVLTMGASTTGFGLVRFKQTGACSRLVQLSGAGVKLLFKIRLYNWA